MSAFKDIIIDNDIELNNTTTANNTENNTENIININKASTPQPTSTLKPKIKLVDEFTLFKLNEFNLYLKDYYKNKPEDKFNFEPPELQRYLINNFYDNPKFCKNFTDTEVFSLYARIKFISKSYLDFKFSDKSKNYSNEQICQAVENKFLNHLLPVLRKIHNGITERQALLKNNTNTDDVKPEENNNDKKEQEQRDFQQEINNNINKNIDNNIIDNNIKINSNIDNLQNKQKTLTEIIDEQEVNSYTANIANKHNLKFYKQLYKIESDTKTINKINKLDNNNVIGEPQTLRDLLGDSQVALFVAKYQHRLEHKFNDYKLKHTTEKMYYENVFRSERILTYKIIATGAGALIAGAFSAPIFMGALGISAAFGIKKLANSIKRFLNKDEPKITPSATLLNANNLLDISVSDFKELVNNTEFKEGIKHDNLTNSINRQQAEENLNKILTEHYYKFNNKKEFYEFSKYFEDSWKEFSRQFDNKPPEQNKPQKTYTQPHI